LDTLLRHFEMLHRLAADHGGAGYLDVKVRDVDQNTGKETAPPLAVYDFGSKFLSGWGVFGSEKANAPKKMVDAVLELTAEAKRHVYAPVALMNCAKHPGPRQEKHIAAVLGMVAQLDGTVDYNDRLPLDPDYVLGCGDQVQAFYLLDKPARVADAKPVALALKESAAAIPRPSTWRRAGGCQGTSAGHRMAPSISPCRWSNPGTGIRALPSLTCVWP
jgi:hypothetical protein